MFPACWGQTDFLISDVLGVIDSRKKFDRESSSEVCKMLGCLNRKYENCIFICQRLIYISFYPTTIKSFSLASPSIASCAWSNYFSHMITDSKNNSMLKACFVPLLVVYEQSQVTRIIGCEKSQMTHQKLDM